MIIKIQQAAQRAYSFKISIWGVLGRNTHALSPKA